MNCWARSIVVTDEKMDNSEPVTALIVDDSPDSLGLLNTVLSSAGMTVLVALGGEQALNIIEQVSPDIVLLDAVMPVMDGFEVCEKIRETSPQTPVIFMTGLTETDKVVKGLEAGAVDYVLKPVNTEEVLARIRVHVHNARKHLTAKAALDSAGQTILAVDAIGTVHWATKKAQKKLDLYSAHPDRLSQELSTALTEIWEKNPAFQVSLSGFSDDGETEEPVEATLLNRLGDQYLIRLSGSSEEADVRTLSERLPITRREADVLFWLSRGKSNWDIATILSLKPRTINKHLEQVYKKLGVDNRTAAAAIALKSLAD